MAKLLEVCGHTVTFERRRYPGCTYTWAYLHVPGEDKAVMLGDPWPAINWPKKELTKVVQAELAERQGRPIVSEPEMEIDPTCVLCEFGEPHEH